MVGTVVGAFRADGLLKNIARYHFTAAVRVAASPAAIRRESRSAFSRVWPESCSRFESFCHCSPLPIMMRSGTHGSWNAYMYQDEANCRLVASAFRNAAGCGTDTGFTDASRSGCAFANAQATAAPQS